MSFYSIKVQTLAASASTEKVTGKAVNKEASHYVRLFGGNKIGNLIF
jgi:hypothetical protein